MMDYVQERLKVCLFHIFNGLPEIMVRKYSIKFRVKLLRPSMISKQIQIILDRNFWLVKKSIFLGQNRNQRQRDLYCTSLQGQK